uniref:Dynactin domain-containing protein n=1 Tax=Syphacia muris TaxID=451379 RepID=A0A0N5ACQ2_9BILA
MKKCRAKNFVFSAIQRCSVERLSRLSQMHVEMSSQERAIDQYIKLLRMDRLDENTGVESLQKTISYFQNVFSVHMTSEWFDGRLLFGDVLSELDAGLQWMKLNTQRIGFFLLPDKEESDLGQLETALLAAVSDCQQLVIRVRNRIPSKGEFSLPQKVDDRLQLAVCSLEKGATILDKFCSMASTQLSMLPDVEGIEVERLKEMLLGAIEKVHGKGKGAENYEVLKSHLYNLRSTLAEIANDIEKDIIVDPETEEKPFPPLLERAHARKQDAVEAESLRWQVEKKEAEITDLRKTIRSKNDDLSNFR